MNMNQNGNAQNDKLVRQVHILGIGIHQLRVEELFQQIKRLRENGGKHLITYVNVHTMNIAYRDERLREAYRRSSITYCDGGGVVMGGRILGRYLPERMTGASFIDPFCQSWQEDGTSLFLLGGRPGVPEQAVHRLKNRYPDLIIKGSCHGFFRRDSEQEDKILSMISKTKPDILLVGFGTPLQEHYVLDNWDRIEARVIWTVGALFDYVSGQVPRCPVWMQEYTLEWLFRFLIEPKRLFNRYMIGNPLFIYRILKEKVTGKPHRHPIN